jgi:hypothetical protein
MDAIAALYHDILTALAAAVGAAIRMAQASPLEAGLITIAVASFVFAWRATGTHRRPGGHYTAWLEVRSNNFENALRLYASSTYNDGGAEARRVLEKMNEESPV